MFFIPFFKLNAYITEILKDIEYKKIEKLEEKEWGEFKVEELFKMFNSTPYHKKQLEHSTDKADSIPYVTRTNKNNGLEDIVKKTR